jgi:hypothetical protein
MMQKADRLPRGYVRRSELTDFIRPSAGFESLSLRQLLPVFSSTWLVAADAERHIQ